MRETMQTKRVAANSGSRLTNSPFAVDSGSYGRWRDWKLDGYPKRADELLVEVRDPRALTTPEAAEILRVLRKTNMVAYSSRANEADKTIPHKLGTRFGLTHLDSNMLADDDGITSLQVVPGKSGRGYIPYSNRRLMWHTDGYYNNEEQQIHAFVLHCVSTAAEGGENGLLDPEIVYILLREKSTDHVRALMAPDAMTIPANAEEGVESRPAQSGPVFSVDAATGTLHMRYTARTRSIEWKRDDATAAAVAALESIINSDSPFVFRHRLAPGQGLLSNNVLHNRTGFNDDPEGGHKRLIYRARYYDRIAGTHLNEIFRDAHTRPNA